ncbi:MAG TPA: hypothetical protein DDW52_29765, partial [Planctomycetaceae bacterium]|nr:hypothetical protein [Planctomycetaceae bacterium]
MLSKYWPLIATAALASGCGQGARTSDGTPGKNLVQKANESANVIENRFGMRFVFIPFPTEAGQPPKRIYLGESEVTWEQHRRFKVASGQPVEPYERTPS